MDKTLTHYGILGMKWGVRRPVGSDGLVKGSKGKSKDDQIKDRRRKDVKNRRSLSDEDLIKKIARLEREKKLRDLTDSEINEGKKAANDIMKQVGIKVATTVISGAVLYGIKAAVTGKVDLADAVTYLTPKPKK